MEKNLANAGLASPPFLRTDKSYLELTQNKCDSLSLSFPPSVRKDEHCLIIDIYSASHQVHPTGHLGWWKCRLNEDGPVQVTFDKQDDRIDVRFGDHAKAEDSWINEQASNLFEHDILAVHLVLRNISNQALVYDSIIYLYNSEDSLAVAKSHQETIRRDFSSIVHTATPWYCWPDRTSVHLLTCDFREHDAIGTFTMDLYRMFSANGIPCRIYADHFDPKLRGFVQPVCELLFAAKDEDLVFYNYSIFDPYLQVIQSLPCKTLLYYHNITPPEFFRIYDAEFAELCHRAHGQLGTFGSFDKLMANSEASASELRSAIGDSLAVDRKTMIDSSTIDSSSSSNTSVSACPPILSVDKWSTVEPEQIILPEHKTLLLYTGRIAPHKRIEDLFQLFAEFNVLDDDSALIIVGKGLLHSYIAYLYCLLKEKYERLSKNIYFLEDVSDGQLKTIYSRCSGFVTMSEHEGFCIPLLEAMHFDKPVFAYAQPAIRNLLAQSGRLIWSKDFPAVAANIHHVLNDESQRQKMITAQRHRVAQIADQANGQAIWKAIEEVLSPDAHPV